MAEETIWRGTSSQMKNLGLFILCGLFCWLIVPIFIALARYLQTKNKIYELTTERLKITEGVFSKVTDTLELYRVKDIETRQPFPLSACRHRECANEYVRCFIPVCLHRRGSFDGKLGRQNPESGRDYSPAKARARNRYRIIQARHPERKPALSEVEWAEGSREIKLKVSRRDPSTSLGMTLRTATTVSNKACSFRNR